MRPPGRGRAAELAGARCNQGIHETIVITAVDQKAIGGIYHILDMANTTLNVMDDMVATVIASRLEGSIQVERGEIIP